MDNSLDIKVVNSKFSINKTLLERSVSQFFALWTSFDFMTKKGNFLSISQHNFSRFHKLKLGPKYKISLPQYIHSYKISNLFCKYQARYPC